MSRQVDIGFQINEKPAITSLGKILLVLKRLNAEKEALAPKGKIKLEVDTGKMKEQVGDLNNLNKELKRTATSMTKMAKASEGLSSAGVTINNTFNNNTNRVFKSVTKHVGEASQGLDGMAVSLVAISSVMRSMMGVLKTIDNEYRQLSENTFGVGVASQLAVNQIKNLNSEFLELAKGTPNSAKALAKATDDLVRTGRSLGEAQTMMTEISKLAVASSESLNDTAGVATKIMVSLGIEAENTGKALTALHSVAIQTASSMGGLAESFKQFAGTLGVFVSTATVTGDELEDYKQNILELGLSATGVLNNLGLSAESAGTKVKVMFSKLIALEKTATNLFNKDMLNANVYVDSIGKLADSQTGSLLTAQRLSEIASQNLPQAVELLSQIQAQGDLSTQTLQKMFTGRHFTEVSAILRSVGGDWERFNKIFAQGVDYQLDYVKQMYNVNNSIKTLKNNLAKLGKDGFGFMGTTIEGGTFVLNKMLDDVDKGGVKLANLLSHTVGLSGTFLGMKKAMDLIAPALGTFSLASIKATIATNGLTGALLANPATAVAVGITALVASIIYLGKSMRDAEINALSFFQTIKSGENLSESMEALNANLEETLKSLGNFDEYSSLDKTTYSLLGLVGITSDWEQQIFSAKEAMREVNKEINKSKFEEKIKQLNASSSQSAKDIESGGENLIESIISKGKQTKLKARHDPEKFEEAIRMSIQSFIKGEIKDAEEITKKFNEILTEGLTKQEKKRKTFSSNELFKLIDETELRNLQEKLKTGEEIKEKQIKLNADMHTAQTNADKAEQMLSEQRKKSYLTNAQSEIALIEKYGKIKLGLVELYGMEALEHVSKKSFGSDKSGLKEFEAISEDFKKANENFKLDGKDSVKYYVESMDIRKQIKAYEKAVFESTTDKERKHNEEMLEQSKVRLDMIQQEEKYRKELLEMERNQTEYRFKYVSDAQKMLDVEYELLKIGQDKHYQSILSHEMSKKELENRKQMAEEGLKDIGYDLGGKSVEQAMNDTKRELDSIRAKGAVRTGAKEDYEKYSQLKELYDLLQKVYEAEQKIALEPIKLMNDVLRDSPSVMATAIASLNTFDDVLNNIDVAKMEKEFSQRHVGTLMGRYNESYRGGKGDFRLSEGDVTITLQEKSIELARKLQEIERKGVKVTKDEIAEAQKLKAEVQSLTEIEKQRLDVKQKARKEIEAEMAIYGQLGGAMSSLGSMFGIDAFNQIGSMMSQFGDVSTKFKTGDMGLDLGKMIGADGKLDINAISKNFESIMAVGQLGQMGGQLMGGLLGGGNSQMAGDLGGIGSMAGMLVGGPVGAMVGSALGGALGGMMGGSAEKDQQKAQEKTAEANRLYQENTDALNKLATNMANLNSGIDSLNSSLISSFSQLPTTGNLNNVTDAMKTMNKTLLSSRDFGDIAYQITKSKKSGGGLFGGKQTVQWTETHTKSLQEMLGQYGYKGTINDMSSEELRNFSEWLEDVKIGENSNVQGMAQIIADYAEALDAMENNIEDFFYDATMEGFEGISSIAQEELKNQLTEFYKNLGMNIDEDLQAEIDKLAEEMSVMVTVMKDVRGEFLSIWKETGKDAGSAFIGAMKPYMESMLGNISQVYFDVFFSDITESLEDSFKSISEELVEMKKLGADLDWGDVTDKLADQFDNVLSAIISAKQQTESFNDVILALQKQALEAGLTLEELFQLGLISGTQGDVLETFKDAILSEDDGGALKAIGDFMGDKIGEALTNTLMNNLFSTQILDFANQLDDVLSGEIKFSQLAGLMSQATSIGLGMEQERIRLEAILSGFKFDQDITYESSSSNVSYSAGTSQQNTYVYNISSSVQAQNLVESDSIQSLADELLDILIEKLKIDKGIDITKNY